LKFYKYCSFNPYILSDIKDKKITLSKASTFNDSFDSLPFYNTKEVGEILQPSDAPYYICSFTKEFSSPIMWGHYGDSNYGFCIEYYIPSYSDSDEAYFQDIISSLILRVEYSKDNKRFDATNHFKFLSENKESFLSNNSREFRDEYVEKVVDLYKYKDKNWAYEKEYRIIFANVPNLLVKESSKGRVSITYRELKITKITGIYFGERSNDLTDINKIYLRDDLKRICNERNIAPYIMKKHETEYKMVAEPFKLPI
jgi:hypothetical protein